MKYASIAFTEEGVQLMGKLSGAIPLCAFAPEKYARDEIETVKGSVFEWCAEVFSKHDALIFIGAAGIAVRAIAPHLQDKTSDPAVVVVDELGRHVIPILSGHIGGANALAMRISGILGAEPVITTATDIHGVPAIDTWAAQNGMAIDNVKSIKFVSSAALRGEKVGVAITERTIIPPFPVTLFLRPRTLTVGIGCKKGVGCGDLENGLRRFLDVCGVSLLSVAAFATIDRKADEPALCGLSQRYAIPLIYYSAQDLREIPGVFAASEWVEKTVGVGNVCERAAVRHAKGRLLMGKTDYEGMTFALAAGEDFI